MFLFNSPAAYFYSLPFFLIFIFIFVFPRLFAYPLEKKQPAYFAGCLNFKNKIYDYFFIINAVIFYCHSRRIICNLDRS